MLNRNVQHAICHRQDFVKGAFKGNCSLIYLWLFNDIFNSSVYTCSSEYLRKSPCPDLNPISVFRRELEANREVHQAGQLSSDLDVQRGPPAEAGVPINGPRRLVVTFNCTAFFRNVWKQYTVIVSQPTNPVPISGTVLSGSHRATNPCHSNYSRHTRCHFHVLV
jgi:hypothetical protein